MSTEDTESGTLSKRRLLYYALMLSLMFLCQVYKQARAASINTGTHSLDSKNPSYWQRFLFSLLHRSEKKME
jgi:hypothetical protein